MISRRTLGPLDIPANLPARFVTALRLLYEARAYAESLQRDVWDFAIEMATLQATGLTATDLRWLTCKGFVDHGVEAPAARKDGRSFHHRGLLTLAEQTCFVLTEAGAKLARALHGAPEPPEQGAAALVPCWNATLRELRVGKTLVKRFHVPAGNQELILAAFQEEGWPTRIDDPLPPLRNMDRKRRLSEAIRRLNRNQQITLLGFHGDGHGTGICWELLG